MDLKARMIKKLNNELGSDLRNLKNIPQIYERLQNNKRKIEENLSLASSEAPSKIKQNMKEVNDIIDSMERTKIECESIYEEIDESLQEKHNMTELQAVVENINYLEKSAAYLQFVKFVDDISTELELGLSSGSHDSCISSFVILKEMCCKLQSSSCHYLKNYVHETVLFWYTEIKSKVFAEYNEILKALKWPFYNMNAGAIILPHNPESIAKFITLTEYLFNLQLPDKILKQSASSDLLCDFKPTCLPVTLLVRPLKQRFIHHFTGDKKTNRRDKPEWFFTQILTWIKEYADWVEKSVQPVAFALGLFSINVKVEFTRALVRLAVEKLKCEISVLQYDDSLFAHAIDEALGFERELRDLLLYPPSEPATVFILTQAHIFQKWIIMEKKFATEKMDAILSSDTAWERMTGSIKDDMKVTECAEAFLSLLSTISDRYNHLPQPGHRIQFLELQLELIDDWRVRLLQLHHEDYKDPLVSLIPSILNTLHYVTIVLQDWGMNVSFLKLHFFNQFVNGKSTSLDDSWSIISDDFEQPSITVFDDAVSLLQRLEKKLIEEITDSIFMGIKVKSKPYRNEKWFAMPWSNEVVSLSVTTSAWAMFQEIGVRLHALQNALAKALFEKSWKNIAHQLDSFLLQDVVLANQFSVGGAKQLQYDIFRNLFPLFGLYTKRPESYFPQLSETCKLQNMLLQSALSLIEAIEGQDESISKEVLNDIKVFHMSPEMVLNVLRTRMDLSLR